MRSAADHGKCRRKGKPMIRIRHISLAAVLTAATPSLVFAQASPFLTGVTSLQENILEWLTPVAIILVMVLGGMAMANRIAQVSSTYGTGEAQTIVENCGNSLILRCSGSDQGGTANFASRLIGQREVLRTNRSRSRRPGDLLSSTTLSEHVGIEPAVMASQIEQLPDLAGYLKFASVPHWQQVTLAAPESPGAGHTRDEAKTQWQRWRAGNATASAKAHSAGAGYASDDPGRTTNLTASSAGAASIGSATTTARHDTFDHE